MRKTKTGRLALAGILTALAMALLMLTVTPIATVGTVALAALCGIPVVVESGRKAGIVHFLAVAILAWLIVPVTDGKLLYTLFFGWYTIAKACLEQKNLPRTIEWGAKFLLLWATFGIGGGITFFFLLDEVSLGDLSWWVIPVGVVASNLLFVVYDRCITGLVGTYMTRLHPTVSRLFHLN